MGVPIDGTVTASVAPVMALPVPDMQKPPCWEGKRFQDRLEAASEGKVEIPAGLKTRPAWLRTRRSAAVMRAARLGVCCRADLEAADSDDLIP